MQHDTVNEHIHSNVLQPLTVLMQPIKTAGWILI